MDKSQVVVPSSGYCKFRLHDLYWLESNWMLELVKKGIKHKVKRLCFIIKKSIERLHHECFAPCQKGQSGAGRDPEKSIRSSMEDLMRINEGFAYIMGGWGET